MTEIIARVVSQKGTCQAGHRVGDYVTMVEITPPGICSWSFDTLFPFAEVLEFGGSFPWEKDPDRTTVACPDPSNPVVFELRRVKPAEK